MNDLNRMMDGIAEDMGWRDANMRRDRPYTGQPHTDTGIRGATEIRGITFRDLRDAFIRAVCLSSGCDTPGDRALYDEAEKGEQAALCSDDVFAIDADLDLIAVSQNLACEVERLMGIYPNIEPLQDIGPTHNLAPDQPA